MRRTLLVPILVQASCASLLGIDDVVPAGSEPDGGDPDAPQVEPTRVVGGGVRDPGIDGILHVFVIDEVTGAPLEGARVSLGAPVFLTGATDQDGRISFDDDLVGPQVISAEATGHVTTTWYGVAGRNATMVLAPIEHLPATATVRGSVAGWDELPTPTSGRAWLYVPIAARRPDGSGGTSGAPCVWNGVDPCAWEVVAPAGDDVVVGGLLVDYDTRGTPDTGDDVVRPDSYWIGELDLAPDQVRDGVIADPEAVATVSIQASFPPALPGFGDPQGAMAVDLGPRGYLLGTPTGAGTLMVPTLTGPLAGARYRFLATSAGEGVATSSLFAVDGGDVDAPSWLAPPSSIDAGRDRIRFVPVTGVDAVDLVLAGADTRWRILGLDARSDYVLPALESLPLGVAEVELMAIVLRFAEPFDPGDFAIPALIAMDQQVASRAHTFTP